MQIRFFFSLFIVLSLGSCQPTHKKVEHTRICTSNKIQELRYAQLFQLEELDNGYLLHVFSPWQDDEILASYILYRGDLEKSEAQYPDADQYIQIPINSYTLHSVSDIGYFKQLNSLDKLVGIADVNWVYNPQIQSLIDDDIVKNIGPSADVNYEILQSIQTDLYIRPAFEIDQAWKSDPRNFSINTFLNLDWKENHPLGRAEWILIMGAFMDELSLADSLFKTTEKEYNQLASKVKNLKNKPDVLVGANYKGIWYLPGGGSYKAILMKDAGADYHWKNEAQSGSLSLNFENVLMDQGHAEVWIEAPMKSKEALLAMDERYALFDAFHNNKTYHNLKRVTSSGGNDYWESGLAQPSLILHDLVNIFHPGVLEDENLYFYQLLDE